MTPFLDSISNLSNPLQLAALKLLVLADERGYVNLEWGEAEMVFGCTHKNMIRKRLGELKKAKICTGSTNCHVNVRMTYASERREYASNRLSSASERREFAMIEAMIDDPSASERREYASNRLSSASERREYASNRLSSASERREYASNRLSSASERREYASERRVGGDYRGGIERQTDRIRILIDRSILDNNFLSNSLSEEQDQIYAMLTDDEILMAHDMAHAAALTTSPDRAKAIVAKWLFEVGQGQEHTAAGLFARLTDRCDQGRYEWRALKPSPEFYRSDFARRHGLEPPRSESDGYGIPDDMRDIAIGMT